VRTWLALLATAACAACEVAGPVVDRAPKPPPPGLLADVVACREPSPCTSEFVIQGETIITELRSLGAPLEAFDEDAGIESVLDPGDIAWSDTSIVLASAVPIEVVIDEAPEPGALIQLHGPVTLRFENIADLNALRIASSSRESEVVLDHVTALDLTMGDAEQRFAGRLFAKHSAFERASMNVETMQLDSAVFFESFIAASFLTSRDGFFETVVLELGVGLFAPSELREVEIRRCDALSFFGSSLWGISIPRCQNGEATRIYDSKVVRGVVDGVIDADTSKFDSLRIGQREPTLLVLWGSNVMRNNFCDFADDIKFERGQVNCSDCTEAAFSEALCKLPQESGGRDSSSSGRFNFCEALDLAEACEDPIPDRPRPQTSED
jgi:hypothetical protein